MSMDQSFHTPSFGDEEFEIPPLSYASSGTASRSVNASGVFGNSMPVEYFKGRLIGGQAYVFAPGLNYNNLGRTYHQSLQHQQSQNVASNHPSCQQPHLNNNLLPPASPQGSLMDNSQAPYQSPPQSTGAGQAMSPHQDVYRRSADMMSPHSVHMQVQSYDNGTYSNPTVHQQGTVQPLQMNMMSQASHMSAMGPPQQQTIFSTISQSQLSSQLGLQIGMGSNTHQGPGSVGSPPPGSNHNSPALETSEDSDDSTPLAHLIGGMKRPSPEPVDISQPKTPKKPKAQKKKKKRDPNEPQKPVSAYALFFRDTQAAIKGQNPNASFGEVSKIVASMWDSLDIETKNNYKKKTETAKKEYLKALAAYRATLVSKAAVDHSDAMYVTNAMSCGSPPAPHSSSNSPPGHMMSPIQKKSPVLTSVIDTMQHVTSGMANQQPSCSHLTSAGKTWCIQQIPPPQQQQSPPHHQQQHMMGNSPPHMMHGSQMVPVHLQQMPQQSPPQNQMNVMGNNPQVNQISAVPPQINHSNSNSPSYPQNMSPASMGGTHQNVSGGDILPPLQNCLRSGCPNPAIDSPDWDREYCSSECVVSHCRDVFTQWVASRQGSNTYASVK